MATGVVSIGSDLERKAWMTEGLIQASSLSFWTQFTGASMDSVVYQETNISAADGHTVVFDFDGNLSGKAIKGKDTAYGKGEQKKKFSDKIDVRRYRLPVDNGDSFDGVNIGDLSINQHSDSRAKLGDLFIRFKDQAIFDAAQGFKGGVAPTHSIQIDASAAGFSYNNLADIERTLRTGVGYMTGVYGSSTPAASRAPLKAFRAVDGRPAWLFVVDSFIAHAMRTNSTLQSLLSQGDMRGPDNRLWKGVLGRVGQLVVVEADSFFGETTSNGLEGSEIEISGLRHYDATNSKWAGESGYNADAASRFSRGLILGAGAVQLAMGKMPDYKFQRSSDFGISSESALEVWMETQKTNWTAESGDYKQAKRAGLDHAVIAVDVKIA